MRIYIFESCKCFSLVFLPFKDEIIDFFLVVWHDLNLINCMAWTNVVLTIRLQSFLKRIFWPTVSSLILIIYHNRR